MKDYVTQIDGAYRITDSRVSLDSVVYAWRDGLSPESINENFPVLTLEEVYSAITFYLANRAEIDTYLSRAQPSLRRPPEQNIEQLRQNKLQLYERLVAYKRQKATTATVVPEPVHQ